MPRPYRFWTDAERLRLEALRMEGLSGLRIAALLGRGLNSVQSELSRLGLRRPRDARRLALLLAGDRAAVAGRELGLKPESVRTARTRLRQAGFRVPDGRRRA